MPADDRATRQAYDVVAGDYARLLPDLRAETRLDRAVLATFVDMMPSAGGVVAEVGCGTGRIAAHLADAGLTMVGLDLSEGMVREARAARPDLAVAVADAGALPLRSGALAGLVAWYSLIHLGADRLPKALTELARVTRPGAPVVLAFQAGDGERVDRATAYGHPVAMSSYRHRVEDVTDGLVRAGFAIEATVRREPALEHETTPQAFLLARRREAAGPLPH